jgi:hypothetical protein
MATGHIVFDLSTGVGSARLVPSRFPVVPRASKQETELYIGGLLLRSLGETEGHSITGVRSVEPGKDPPDVHFHFDGKPRGLEVTELVPEDRFGRDAILRRFRAGILKRLTLSEKTRDWVVTIMLADDYAKKISMPDPTEALASTLESFFQSVGERSRSSQRLVIPPALEGSIHAIVVRWWDLSGDPRTSDPQEPLIEFSAAHTQLVPERDFPRLIDERLGRKRKARLQIPTWLVVWSEHYALGSFTKEIIACMERYRLGTDLPYERLFYLHHHETNPSMYSFR